MKTLRIVLDEFLEYRRSLNPSLYARPKLRSALLGFIRFLDDTFAVQTPDRLRPRHLHAYQKHLAQAPGRHGLPMKPSAINTRVYTARALLEFLRRRGFLVSDWREHLSPVRLPKLLPGFAPEHRQVKRILRMPDTSTHDGILHRAVMELLYTSGVRVGELVGLTLDELDLERGRAIVHGKGGKDRVVPVGATALRWLTSYIRAVRPFNPGHRTFRHVFLNRRGVPLGRKSVQEFVPRYARAARVPSRVTPHAFRRSCTTELIREGANVYHVKDLLGHCHLTSLAPYTRLTIDDLKKTHARCHPRERDP